MPQPTTLSSGQLNRADDLSVELHEPATEPAFILVKWPAVPSVASLDNFDTWWQRSTASCPMPAHLSRMRGERRTR